MNFAKKLLAGSITAAAVAVSAVPAQAEVSGSVGIASTYLWRGYELGSGTPVVWGDLSYSNSGFYTGMWTSSGDGTAGTEYDLYLGYGGESGDFSYDVFIVTYVYPTGPDIEAEVDGEKIMQPVFLTDGDPGDFMEIVGTIGYGPASLTIHKNIAGETGGYAFTEDYMYYKLGVDLGSFSLALGKHDEGIDGEAGTTQNATHFDATYNYNDNLSFTFSALLDSEHDDYDRDEPKPTFVVGYSIPLSM